MRIVLTDSARLPLKVCRGGEIKRKKLAETYSKILFNELRAYKETSCQVKAFKEALDKIIGKYNIKYEIKNINNSKYKDAIAALSKITNLKITPETTHPTTLFIEGFDFYLPIHNNNITNKSSALHEARHFFDHICNPKTTTLHACKLNDPVLSEKKYKIHNLFLNTFNPNLDMGILAETTIMHLQDIPDKVVIDTLQEVRHSLKSEINAYTDEIKFLTKSKADKYQINNIREILKDGKLKEKLKLANKLLREKLIEMWTKRVGDVPASP